METRKGEFGKEIYKKFYEEEGRRLALGYKIAKLRQKLGLTLDELFLD